MTVYVLQRMHRWEARNFDVLGVFSTVERAIEWAEFVCWRDQLGPPRQWSSHDSHGKCWDAYARDDDVRFFIEAETIDEHTAPAGWRAKLGTP